MYVQEEGAKCFITVRSVPIISKCENIQESDPIFDLRFPSSCRYHAKLSSGYRDWSTETT